MRKLLLTLAVLCGAVSTWAGPTDLPQITTDLEHPIYYTIVNTRSSQPGGYMYFAGENVGLKDEQVATIADKHMFYFTGSHDALYVHNKATNLKLASVGSWSASGAEWAVGVSPKGGGLAFGPKGGLNSDNCWNEKNYTTDANTSDFTTWSANDDGSVFLVALAEDCEIKEEAFYTIECPLFENKQGVKKGLIVNGDGSLGWNTVDLTNKNCYWIPTKVDGTKVALKNLGTGKFLNGTEVVDETVESTVKVLGLGQFNIVSNGTTVHANGHGEGASASGNIVSWNTGVNGASAWQFVEQQDPDAVQSIEITYEFTYNGNVVDGYTQTVQTVTGAEYPNITVSFPFGVSATKPVGTIATEDAPAKTVTIPVEENLPFEPAKDFASIAKWYYMKNKGDYYLSHVENKGYIALGNEQKTVDENNKDAFTWAFVGNPFDGYQIVNRAAGNGYILSSSTTTDGNTGANTHPVMTATPVAEGNNELWVLTASSFLTNGFFIAQKDHGSNRMNNRDSKLAYWTGGADKGSTFTVTERDLTGLADLQALIDQVDVAIAVYGAGGTTVGYYTAESVDALTTALNAAKNAAAKNESAAANSEAQVALQNAVAALETIQPTEGAFYYISSAMPSSDGRSGQKMYVNNAGAMHFQNTATLANVFQFVPAGDNTFYLYNVERGTYLDTNKPHNGGQATAVATTGTVKVAIANMGRANAVSIIPNGGAMLHAQAAGSQVVAWNNTDNAGASAWIISEVTDITALSHELTVGDAGYATLCLGYNATIPTLGEESGVYTAAVVNGYAAMTKVEGVLPANTAVIVKATAGTYNFNYAKTGELATVSTNELKGTTVNMNITEPAYVLSKGDKGVGLYTAGNNVSTNTENDDPEVTFEAWKNNAFKAYLPKPIGSGARFLIFDFGTETGIDQLEGENGNVKTEVYDLSGRRVQNAQKGIFIVNGKKVIR